jgi:hypothetical protein
MTSEEAQVGQKPAAEIKPIYKHGYYPRHSKKDETPPPKPEPTSTLSSLFSVGKK